MKDFFLSLFRTRAAIAGGLALLLHSAALAGIECHGEAEWQESMMTNRTRCGIAGLLDKTNYYTTERRSDIVWKMLPNLPVAVNSNHTTTYHFGGLQNRCNAVESLCRAVSSNSWYVRIPYTVTADLSATEDGPCDRVHQLNGGCTCEDDAPFEECKRSADCGNLCQIAFNQLQTSCCEGGLPVALDVLSTQTNENVQTDATLILDRTSTLARNGGTQRHRQEVHLADPITLPEFTAGTLANTRNGPWAIGKFLFSSLYGDDELACLTASLLRYRIKFESKTGLRYKVTWDLQVIQRTPERETNIVTGLSWTGLGNGHTVYSDYFYLPEPGLNESYDGEVINLKIVSEEGCADGNCDPDRDTPGDGPDELQSAAFLISLGAGTANGSAGVLAFHEATPSAIVTTPAALRFDVDSTVVTIVTNADGAIHIAAPTVLARIEAPNQTGYWVHCSARQDGAYATNAPFISHWISGSSVDAVLPFRLQHVKFRSDSDSAVTNEFICEGASPQSNVWRLLSGNGLKEEQLSKTWLTPHLRRDRYTLFHPQSHLEVYRREELYWVTNSSDYLLSRIVDPAGLALTTTNSYNEQGRLRLTINPDGSWERREYRTDGLLERIIRPFTNQPPAAPAEECRVTEMDYRSVAGSPDLPGFQPGRPRLIREKVRGQIIRATMYAFPTEHETRTRRARSPAAPVWDDPGNESTIEILDPQHRVIFSEHVDETREVTSYADDESGRTTIRRSYDSERVEFQRTEERVDSLGQPVFRRTYDRSGALLDEEEFSAPDEFERPTRTAYLDGSSSTTVRQDCCSRIRSVDRDGVVATYAYDALRRLVATTRLGVTISNLYDSAGRRHATLRQAASNRAVLVRGLAFDNAGRIITETNELGAVTRHTYSYDTQQGEVTTTRYGDGGTRMVTRHRDGTTASVTGSAVFPERSVYGVMNQGGSARAYSTRIALDAEGHDTAEWRQTLSDFAERDDQIVFAGPGAPVHQMFFNRRGQLWKERDPDGVSTLYQYDARGNREFTCLDVDRNGIIDFEGSDSITQVVTDIVPHYGTVVRRTRTLVWTTPGSDSPTLLRTVETSLDGLRTWETAGAALKSTVRSRLPDGRQAITETSPAGTVSRVMQMGRLVAFSEVDATGRLLRRETYDYDLYGRRIRVNDSQRGTTHYRYNDADQVTGMTTPSPGLVGGRAQTTLIHYDVMGRATNVVQPDGARGVNVFSPRGELIRSSGALTYPAAYDYDAQGRLKHMTNWSDFAAGTGPRVTTWDYEPARGFLVRKAFADGAGPRYDYTAAGRLRSRQWARGVMTRYAYDAVGNLTGINYDDGVTPTVAYTHDRRGRPITASVGTNTWKRIHNDAGQLTSEFGIDGVGLGLMITNQYDPANRRTRVAAFDAASAIAEQAFTYDPAGRLATVRSGAWTAHYTYDSFGPLPQQTVFRHNGALRLSTTREYDALGRLAAVASQPVGADAVAIPSVGFAYAYNEANQRTRVALTDDTSWAYDYDALGQVVGARRRWADGSAVSGQQFNYAFDHIGNRLATWTGGDANAAGLRAAAFEVNSLNQLTRRDVPSSSHIIGSAPATASVTINDLPADRHGEYCHAELPSENSQGPLWQPVVCRAAAGNVTNLVTGHIFVPRSPESFRYDADGNLVEDGRWTYRWDAENRLVAMEAHDFLPAGARVALAFTYDDQGRRTSKTASRWTGAGWTITTAERFLYDNERLLVTLNASNRVPVRSFVWGLDQSGEFQQAGGVGGLLMLCEGNNAYLVLPDGNGNVVGLIDGTSGQTAATYEYGPFGESIRRSGPMARTNPFRFATKFQDEESDLIQFGHRAYQPGVGIWLSRDPLSQSHWPVKTSSPYCGNDAINDFDLDGRFNWSDAISDWVKSLSSTLAVKLFQDPLLIDEIHDVSCPIGCERFLAREERATIRRIATATIRVNLSVIKTQKLVDILTYRHTTKEYRCCQQSPCRYQTLTQWRDSVEPPRPENVPGLGFHLQRELGDNIIVAEVKVTDIAGRSRRWRNCTAPCTPLAKWVTIRTCKGGNCVDDTHDE